MAAFQTNARGKTPLLRVYDRKGKAYIRTAGTNDRHAIAAIEQFLQEMRKAKRWDVLDLIIGRRLNAAEAFRLSQLDLLSERVSALHAALQGEQEAAKIPDLSPLVTQWAKRANPKYVRQVRRLIPDGARFPATDFTLARLSRFFDGLTSAKSKDAPLSGSTLNRYRVALSQFAKWLVQRGILSANPLRDMAGFGEEEPRMVWYDRATAEAIIDRLSGQSRVLEALMYGTGLEWDACQKLYRADIDLKTTKIQARGGKTRYRTREVRVTVPWAWAIVRAHIRSLAPDTKVFTLSYRDARKAHSAAVAAQRATSSTLHDWRHTYAVNALKEGMKPSVVKRQLGHSKRSTLLETVYGVHDVTDADYETSVTTPVTTPRNQVNP